jgi:hypothetical protein
LLGCILASCNPRARDRATAGESAASPEPVRSREAASSDAGAVAPSGSSGTAPAGGERGDGPRLYVLGGSIEVVEAPRPFSGVIGSVRAGGSLRLEAPFAPLGTDGCQGGWYAVLPRGFVCESRLTTRDALDSRARLRGEFRLASGAALPASYGIAEDTPVYVRLPTRAEQLRAEPGLARRRTTSEPEEASSLPPPRTEIPDELRTGALAPVDLSSVAPGAAVIAALPAGSRVAWVAELDDGERHWLVTPDLLLLPRDRVTPAIVSGFHGVELTDTQGVAFVGSKPEPKYRKDDANGRYVDAGEKWTAESAIFLAEPANRFTEEKFLQTSEPGIYVRVEHVIVAHPTPPTRWGLPPGVRWIEVSARRNLLLLREGSAVAFATLVSVGRVPPPHGRYRVFSKHLTYALPFERSRPGKADTPDVLLASDSPNARTPIALYAAWWFYAWGAPNAAEGISLAPLDARRVFDWASPDLPEGRQSARGEGTWVIVHD